MSPEETFQMCTLFLSLMVSFFNFIQLFVVVFFATQIQELKTLTALQELRNYKGELFFCAPQKLAKIQPAF